MAEEIEHAHLYIISSVQYQIGHVYKIGCTSWPRERLINLLTACPPDQIPSTALTYIHLWRVNAESRVELLKWEKVVHRELWRFHLEGPGGREWFKLLSCAHLNEVVDYIRRQTWIIEEYAPEDIPTFHRGRTQLQSCPPNPNFIREDSERKKLLNEKQADVISKLLEFIYDSSIPRGYITAPCGSGKTVMVARALEGLNCVVVVVPSSFIAHQWRNTLIEWFIFGKEEIIIVSSDDSKWEIAHYYLTSCGNCKLCIIITSMSSHKLIKYLEYTDIVIFDEAHHMAGEVGESVGSSRRLAHYAIEIGHKMLSMTATPRHVFTEDPKRKSISMGEDFGPLLASLNLRDLINAGVLPDYRVVVLESEEITSKSELLVAALESKEMVKDELTELYKDRYIINHLLVYVGGIEQAVQLKRELSEYLDRASVFLLVGTEDGVTVSKEAQREMLKDFERAPRAILISCQMLREGIDIPSADSVAILVNSSSLEYLIQALLRPGRWYLGKEVFSILIPIVQEDKKNEVLQQVLEKLALVDSDLLSEITLRSQAAHRELGKHKDIYETYKDIREPIFINI